MNTINQLSIFLENKSGRLQEALEVLAVARINITALTIADTSEYGIVRLLVSAPAEACALLKEAGFTVNLTEIFALSVSHAPGSLAAMLAEFTAERLSIEYMYAFCLGTKALIAMRTDNREKAFEIISRNGFAMLTENEIETI